MRDPVAADLVGVEEVIHFLPDKVALWDLDIGLPLSNE